MFLVKYRPCLTLPRPRRTPLVLTQGPMERTQNLELTYPLFKLTPGLSEFKCMFELTPGPFELTQGPLELTQWSFGLTKNI